MTIDVIIPALNEEQSIGFVLRDIPKHLSRTIYVTDNGSSDRTVEVAQSEGAKVLYQARRGYGSACLKAMDAIASLPSNQKPDAVAFLDADYSDHPAELVLLVRKLEESQADLVIGSRVLGKAQKGSLTTVQRFGNRLSTWLIEKLFGYHFTDLGPFRIIRYDALLKLNMQDPDYGWTVEMQVKAAQHKLMATEVPVSYKKRIGKSKVSGTIRGIFGAGSKILFIIFKTYVKG
ncbi:MAG: glycosyltransferase family 2 protein [Saprospiraceae bacterium]|nr:glycosyltransferase family 2 protein [Saprospiraceae bacterium]